MVPHGVSVVVNAPAVFRFTAQTNPERHRESARLLGDRDGDLSAALENMMRRARVPVGLSALGYTKTDVPALTQGTIVQKRLLNNAPRDIGEAELAQLFSEAL